MGMFQRSGWDQKQSRERSTPSRLQNSQVCVVFPFVKVVKYQNTTGWGELSVWTSQMDSVLVQSTFTGLMSKISLIVSA